MATFVFGQYRPKVTQLFFKSKLSYGTFFLNKTKIGQKEKKKSFFKLC
jgi:hypothetical protein